MDGIAGGILVRCTSSSLTQKAAGGSFVHKFGAGVRFFSSTEAPPHIVLAMPALSPTMFIRVKVILQSGERRKGIRFLAKILAPEGSKDVAVGQPIAITVEELDDIHKIPDSILIAIEAKEEKVETSTDLESKERTPKSTFSRINPAAKLLLLEFGLDASKIEASGLLGTLLKGDVLAAAKSGFGRPDKAPKSSQETLSISSEKSQASLPTTPTSQLDKGELHEDIPNSQIRKVIARRLFELKHNTPHSYLSSDVILDPLLAFRKELKEQLDVKVSVNDIVIKAVALALKSVPTANAYWDEEKGEAIFWDFVDISIAVATKKA